jgi:hypothetical protein
MHDGRSLTEADRRRVQTATRYATLRVGGRTLANVVKQRFSLLPRHRQRPQAQRRPVGSGGMPSIAPPLVEVHNAEEDASAHLLRRPQALNLDY